MLHPVALLLCLRKTRPLMLQRLCFLLAIWQHLYWKAQNCRVYTVPTPPTPQHTHSDTHTHTTHRLRHGHSNLPGAAVQTSRLLFMCLLAEFEQCYECALTPNVISDIRGVSAVWRRARCRLFVLSGRLETDTQMLRWWKLLHRMLQSDGRTRSWHMEKCETNWMWH